MKHLLLLAAMVIVPAAASQAQEQNPLSVHVLSTETGQPAGGITVVLEKRTSDDWTEINRAVTEDSGRIPALFPTDQTFEAGDYRVDFETGAYYKDKGASTFFPEVTVPFTIDDTAQHYHIPLLLSPYGYTTYRGS